MADPSTPSLSLVYLMYDEEENVGRVLDEALAYCRTELDDWEIIVVDDGSSDAGPDIVRALAADEPRLRLVQHETNLGMGAGMASGIAAGTKDVFCMFPADGQLAPTELRKMLPLLAGADIVLTVYPHRHSTAGRAVMSRVFRDVLALGAGMHFQLEGLYLFPMDAAKRIAPRVGAQTFFFSFELIQRGLEEGLTWALTTIDVRARLSGGSKVANVKRVRRIVDEVRDYRRRRASESST